MHTAKAYQIESVENGALGMACQKAQVYVDAAHADTTRVVYAGAWARWAQWCAVIQTAPLPAAPEAVAAYLAALARTGKSVATIKGALAAIGYGHSEAAQPLDLKHRAIAAVMGGIRRASSRPIRRAAALQLADLRRIIAAIDGNDVRSLRDCALLLVGFFAALRRAELVALDFIGEGLAHKINRHSRVEIRPQGLLIHITGAKSSAATQTVAIPRRPDDLCAARALERYLAATGIAQGPVFRPVSKSDRLLARRLDPTGVRHILTQRAGGRSYSPHSLRAGFITTAAAQGAPEHIIAATSRHRSVEVLRGYIHRGDAFVDAAGGYI